MKYVLPSILATTPAFAHGDKVAHFHAADMLGLALSVLLLVAIAVVWSRS